MTKTDHPVRDLVAQADRQRRARALGVRLRQLAPLAAGAALAVGLGGRFLLGWPAWVGIAVLLAGALGLGIYASLQRRTRPTTDAIASSVDAAAGLAGELRSAHWFESQVPSDPWADFHLNRATEHARAVDWAALFPHVRSSRPWIATLVLSVLVIGFGVRMPARNREVAAPAIVDASELPAGLPVDLQKKLAALLAQLDQAMVSKDPSAKDMPLAELKDLMAKLDPALQKKLAEMLEKKALGDAKKTDAASGADQRPDPAENATAGLPEDVKWALENMEARMAQSNDDRKPADANQGGAAKAGEKSTGAPQAQQKGDAASETTSPLMREAAAEQGSKVMMGNGGPMGGDSRPGSGASNDAAKGAAEALLVAQALRKELVEANADALGENVDKEDLRRKTEQGKSSLGFTRVAPPRTFEPSRATAPPPVPEARRPLLFNYFIRR